MLCSLLSSWMCEWEAWCDPVPNSPGSQAERVCLPAPLELPPAAHWQWSRCNECRHILSWVLFFIVFRHYKVPCTPKLSYWLPLPPSLLHCIYVTLLQTVVFFVHSRKENIVSKLQLPMTMPTLSILFRIISSGIGFQIIETFSI